MDISRRLYRTEQVRELDRLAIEVHGVSGYELMNRAAAAAFRACRERWPHLQHVTVCCGGGNNGGDGYVLARLARMAGLEVQLIALRRPDELGGDAARAARDWLAGGGRVDAADAAIEGEVIVDALLGTGLKAAPAAEWAELIGRINRSGRPIMAMDVPSGLDADTGMAKGAAVRADLTVSFVGNKRGLYTGQGGRWCGQRLFADLELPLDVHAAVAADAHLLHATDLRGLLPPRAMDVHKGDLGHVLVVGGNHGMAGAALLAAMAALRSGAGLVSLATRAEHAALVLAAQPELMAHGAETLELLDARIERADVIALGPGLGQDEWSQALYRRVLASDVPRVLDADALNWLAVGGQSAGYAVLTPHPGEAARLLGISVAEVQADRFAAARELARRYEAVVVLKGHGTLIADFAGRLAVCPYGNPAMASAGMGDALTGIIASLVGQGLSCFDAACGGVVAHALAGDAAAVGRRQILATDLINRLAGVLPA